MKKNIILVVALFALMAVNVFAQDAESDFKVKKTGNTITITEYVGKKTAVNIPSTIQNLPVTTIDDFAFAGTGIASIIIPNSVKNIGAGAFSGCTSLASLTIPNGVTIIQQNAFSGTGLTSVTIPDGVTAIEEQAFENCASLKSITIPNSVKLIKNDAFTGCTSLAGVTFQGTIPSKDFYKDAFMALDLYNKYYATDKTNGTPGTYTTTAPLNSKSTWTKQTSAATTAVQTPQSTQANPESDFQVRKAGNTIWIIKYVGTKKEVIIPPTIQNLPVVNISNEAFANTGITSVIIPDGVTSIGISAYSGCASLASVTIPNSVKTISNNAFADCKNLTSVTFIGTLPWDTFNSSTKTFPGDLRKKFYATDEANGTPGTYTRPDGASTTWTKK